MALETIIGVIAAFAGVSLEVKLLGVVLLLQLIVTFGIIENRFNLERLLNRHNAEFLKLQPLKWYPKALGHVNRRLKGVNGATPS